MGEEHSNETKIALMDLRISRLEEDRKYLLGAAIAVLGWIATQILPFIPVLLKGAGK